jgi:hypothetical protein
MFLERIDGIFFEISVASKIGLLNKNKNLREIFWLRLNKIK